MCRRNMLLIFAAVLMAFSAVIIADESSAEICDDVRVFIENPDGTYAESMVDGVQTVREAVNAALDEQGRTMKVNLTETTIISVDGRKADTDCYWRVFQWLPDGNTGWGVQTFSKSSNEKMKTGTTYCIHMAEMSNEGGTIVYTAPDFEPESTGYIFIRFANGFSPENSHVQSVFTPEIREDGFWVSGTGSNMGAVLKDAIDSNWPGELELHSGNDGGIGISSWINKMFGLGDVNMGGETWAYWSQWTWVDHQWGFNNWTLGYYDPAVYKYMECIYLISTPDPYGDGYIIDKGGPDPNPEKDEIVCMKNKLTASFVLEDGSLMKEVIFDYGKPIDMSDVPEPESEGRGFTGWGDVTALYYTDVTFTAGFVDITPDMNCITYLAEDHRTVIAKEYLLPGNAAVYTGTPVKVSSQQYDYRFIKWSSDLSNVTSDMQVTPVFEPVLRSYDVHFCNFDRSAIGEPVSTEYGTAVVCPEAPERESTVMYRYIFVAWSLTPNNYVPVDLEHITDTTYVFAYYEPTPREYEITFIEGDAVVGKIPGAYGAPIGKTCPIDLFDGYLAKMYQDRELTSEYSVNHIVIGDTTVYVKKIPGTYDAERNASGEVVGDEISLTFDAESMGELTQDDGCIVMCDISQYPNGTSVNISYSTLEALFVEFGEGCMMKIIVPRGYLIMDIADLMTVVADEGFMTFSVGNGPSSVKISSALKKIDYSGFYRVDMRVGGRSVMDLSELSLNAVVGLTLGSEGLGSADVWNITSTGAITHIVPTIEGQYARFSTDLLQFYAVGSDEIEAEGPNVHAPYGETVFVNDGSGMNGHSTLMNISVDCHGGVLFIPSSNDGCTLRMMAGGCLNSVVNAGSVVIPVTVQTFVWNNWFNSGIKDLYFLGDCPVFEGDAPSTVRIHAVPGSEGWDSVACSKDLIIHTYDGSYKKDVYRFTYFLIDGEITVHRYLSGSHVTIPEWIAVDGAPYPVVNIGDAAFMRSDDAFIRELYGIEHGPYDLTEVELTPSLRNIMTRAFYDSNAREVISAGSIEYIWDEAFSNSKHLNMIMFGDSLLFIGESAFSGCDGKSFTRFIIPDSVQVLGDRAFFGCSNLANVSLGDGLSKIPYECFSGCAKLTNLELPDSVSVIEDRAFYDCTGLQFVDLNRVSEVGAEAFSADTGESSLEFIVLGDSMTSLGTDCFLNSKKLSEIEVHCPLFDSFEAAFRGTDLSGITVFASDDVLSDWSGYGAVPIEEKIPNKDNTLLVSVEIGMIVMFLIIGIICYRSKMRVRV